MLPVSVLVLMISAVAVAPAVAQNRSNFDRRAWLQGAAGMVEAVNLFEKEGRPMVVYFYTDWCPYCRQFERDLLSLPEVEDYFSRLIAVLINPETGPEEAEIARYYGVQGYPAFFVHSIQNRTLSRIERFQFSGGRPRLKTAAEFIAACEEAARR
jgi:thioredoxin-related protein